MRLLKSINLIDDKKQIKKLNIASIFLLILFFNLFTFVTLLFNSPQTVELRLSNLFWGSLSLILILVIHVLIHGFFFKIFNTEGKVKFGFKNGLAYATSPNSFYSKGKFLIILLAPFALITIILFILYLLGVASSHAFVWLASLHASSCAGDFYFSSLIVNLPSESYIEDTEKGINFYLNKEKHSM